MELTLGRLLALDAGQLFGEGSQSRKLPNYDVVVRGTQPIERGGDPVEFSHIVLVQCTQGRSWQRGCGSGDDAFEVDHVRILSVTVGTGRLDERAENTAKQSRHSLLASCLVKVVSQGDIVAPHFIQI